MTKILLIEDNEMNRDMLFRRLEKRGFETPVAIDGLSGIATAQQHQPDLILMDMSLPGLDGWQASRQLKSDNSTANIPIIALTAHAMAEDRDRALAAGCDEYETKPVELSSLLEKIAALVNRPKP